MLSRRILGIVLTVCAGLVMSVAAPAQITSAKAEIPFDFTIRGNEVLPSGTYWFREGSSSSVLKLEADGQNLGFVMMRAGQSNASYSSVLVFNRYGSRYFASALRLGSVEFWFTKSHAEREVQRSSSLKPERVLVAMQRQ